MRSLHRSPGRKTDGGFSSTPRPLYTFLALITVFKFFGFGVILYYGCHEQDIRVPLRVGGDGRMRMVSNTPACHDTRNSAHDRILHCSGVYHFHCPDVPADIYANPWRVLDTRRLCRNSVSISMRLRTAGWDMPLPGRYSSTSSA